MTHTDNLATERLKGLIAKIEDERLRETVRAFVNVEIEFRSSKGERFPMKKLRKIVDNSVQAVLPLKD